MTGSAQNVFWYLSTSALNDAAITRIRVLLAIIMEVFQWCNKSLREMTHMLSAKRAIKSSSFAAAAPFGPL